MNEYRRMMLTPSLPTSFENALSYEEQVIQLENLIKIVQTNIENLCLNDSVLQQQLDHIRNELAEISQGFNIPDYSIKLIKLHQEVTDFMQNSVNENIQNVAKFLSFGLTDDGYFEVIIPKNWSDIQFTTSENGELILNF